MVEQIDWDALYGKYLNSWSALLGGNGLWPNYVGGQAPWLKSSIWDRADYCRKRSWQTQTLTSGGALFRH